MSSDRDRQNFMSSSVESAGLEAAVADGVLSKTDDLSLRSKKAGLRRGKWTVEEEFYANRLIYEFKLGLLPLTDGTTLRTFLSKLLNCDPMRISKKFVGQNCIGKQVFRRRQQDLEKLTPEQIENSRKELADLERKFLERVAQTNRSKSSGSGVKGLKDGKVDCTDENGNAILAPWMIPPDDVGPKPNSKSSENSVLAQPAFSYGSNVTSSSSQSRSNPQYQQHSNAHNSSQQQMYHNGTYRSNNMDHMVSLLMSCHFSNNYY